MPARQGYRSLVAAIAVALLFGFAAVAQAAAPGTDFRVSTTGVEGDTYPGAFNPDVAYNSTANEYLIVWYGDADETFDYEIYGQRVDASGDEIGGDFRISSMTGAGASERIGLDPAVTYNPTANEYLVIWYGDGLTTDNEYEIFGQRVSATGTEVGGDFRISNVGDDGSTSRTALRDPEVVYNAQANQYLAVWSGNSLTLFSKYEIWGQIISATGTEVGTDFRISTTGGDNVPSRGAFNPVVGSNSTNGDYLVAWYGNPTGAAGENEIYGQRLNSAGVEQGGDFRISNVGPENNGLYEPDLAPPAIAYNSTGNQYLVTWTGNGSPLTVSEYETFGQLVSATGIEIGGDFRISNVGNDGDAARNTFDSAVTYNSVDDEYLVAWYGDIGAEIEVCGQRVDADGTQLGGDVRLSNVGPDGHAARTGFFPALAFNSQANEYLATWYGDGLTTDDEFEVFARRVGTATAACSSTRTTPISLDSVGHSSRRLTATWTLPGGFQTAAIEAATSPETDADGFFLAQNTVLYDEDVAGSARTYTSPGQLPPGTYYVHVAAYNPASPTCIDPFAVECVWEFSTPPAAVTIPPDPSASSPPTPRPPIPAPTPLAPKNVVKLTVTGSSTQRVLGRTRALVVQAACDQACTLTASGRVSVPGASKVFRLRSVKRSLAANKRVTLRLKLSGKTLRAIRSALKKRKRVTGTVSLTAKTAGGATGTSRKAIRIRR